jgi:hypothetical protein
VLLTYPGTAKSVGVLSAMGEDRSITIELPGGFVLHDVLVSGAGYPLILRAQPAEVFRRSATAGEVNPQQQQQRLFEMNSHNGSLLKEFPFRQTTPGRGEVRLCLQAYRHLLRHDR